MPQRPDRTRRRLRLASESAARLRPDRSRRRRGVSFRTTAAIRGFAPIRTTIFASAPGITRTFSPTRRTPTTVYYLNTGFFRSTDGGRTYASIQTPHGDNHGLWIAPNDPQRMIESNDGGANVTFNGGRSWSSIMNQPTAQFYRVALDNDFPYHAYGAQQDNTTVRTATRGRGGITEKDWYDVGGGESGWIAPDLRDTNVVYAGSYGNLITRFDARTGVHAQHQSVAR